MSQIVTITAVENGVTVYTKMRVTGSGEDYILPTDSLPFNIHKATDLRINGEPFKQEWCNEAVTLPTISSVRRVR